MVVRTRGERAFSGCSPGADDGAAPAAADWTCYGVYYDTPCAADFDLGCERSNYHGCVHAPELQFGRLTALAHLASRFAST